MLFTGVFSEDPVLTVSTYLERANSKRLVCARADSRARRGRRRYSHCRTSEAVSPS